MVIYLLFAVLYFTYRIFTKKNKQLEVLLACAYVAGAGVFVRMTKAFFFYETGKYLIILFIILGFFYSGFSRKAFIYVVFLLLLVPGILVSFDIISYDINFRKIILFNLSGPICLAFCAIYCYGKTFKLGEVLKIMDYILYPLIATTVYIYFYSPDIQDVVTNTESNSALSGGYGPNQVATVLGLGVFILFSRLFLPYKNKLVHFVMMLFLVSMAYRALLTFSRGGVFVSVIMCAVFIVVYYFSTGIITKAKVTIKFIGVAGVALAIWLFTILQTGGLIENRYVGKDALGREKQDITTGRGDLVSTEIEVFKENPVFGIGVGRVKEEFLEELGVTLPTHNEVSRMLSEHGLFGIFALLLLVFSPIITKLSGRKNIYFVPFMLFWALTIIHSSMRIAAPAFLYGLALLNIEYDEKKDPIRRQQALE